MNDLLIKIRALGASQSVHKSFEKESKTITDNNEIARNNQDDAKSTTNGGHSGDHVSNPEVLPLWLNESIPTPAVKLLLWLNVGVFLAMVNSVLAWNAHIAPGAPTPHESILVFSSRTLFAWGANAAWVTILNREYWRILASTFIHASIFHLAMNAYVLWTFSSMVERLFGPGKLVYVYILSATAASVCSLVFINADGISVGASGAIFGTIGALVAFFAVHRSHFPKVFFRTYARIFLVFAAYSIISPVFIKGMDNASHLGGFLVGFCAALTVLPKRPGVREWIQQDFLQAAALTVLTVSSFWIAIDVNMKRPKILGEQAYFEAVTLLKNYDPQSAIAYLDRAQHLMPDNVDVYLDRAAAFGMLKMHRESVNDLNKALLIDPKNKKGYFERAARLHSLGQDRLAIADLNKVLELKPKTILALSNRAWYQAILGQIENAIADSTEAISLDPNSPWAYDTRGVSFCLKGMYSQALTDFDKYIQLKSKNIKNGAIYYHRAFAYYNLGKTELAKQDLIRARASNYQLEPCEKKWFRAMLTDL